MTSAPGFVKKSSSGPAGYDIHEEHMMADDLKGGILQRDGKTYAVTTRIPAGIVTPWQLETIAAVGKK